MKMQITFFLFLLLGANLITTNITAQAINVGDSLALVDLYNSTDGKNWTTHDGWLKKPVGKWFGIDTFAGRVNNITLTNNNLTGVIPVSIGNLHDLRGIFLQDNHLYDTIPSSIGNLTELYSLYLYNNNLTGNIPTSIVNATNLGGIIIFNNQLSGSIPSEIGNLTKLGELSAYDNKLTGSIPSSLGNIHNLHYLELQNNQLTGSIPPELGNVGYSLYSIILSNNKLTGNIPIEITNLPSLTFLFLDNNELTGILPNKFGEYNTSLFQLNLSHNHLRGPIADQIGRFKVLSYLNLEYNNFSGYISDTLTTFQFSALLLSHNQFTFNGIESIAKIFPEVASYDHQASIPIIQNGITLSVSAGGTQSNNIYRWFKKGESSYTEIIGDSIFHPNGNGTYFVKVANKIAKGLKLKSDTITYKAPEITNKIYAAKAGAIKAITEIIFFPNPTKDILHISTTANTSFSLMNQDGKFLITKIINGNGTINVANLNTGIYFLKNNNNGGVKKIIITK